MMRKISTLFLVLMCLIILPAHHVYADVAPPLQPPGFNPQPGSEITQVRMLAETVTIDILDEDPPRAHFNAQFTLQNLGTTTETMMARFPIAVNDGFFNVVEIADFEVWVDGQATDFERIQGPEPMYGFEDESVPWAAFAVTFPPGKDVSIEVAYDLDGTGYPQETSTSFYYILSTGAGWKGTIGEGRIILRLPYAANRQNLILGNDQDPPQFDGREAVWTFSDLEPDRSSNMTFEIVKPEVWGRVLEGLSAVAQDPADGRAFGSLGEAYKQALFASPKGYPRLDDSAAPMYAWSRQAYAQAVNLVPEDGLIHAGYAELLLDYHYWQYFQEDSLTADLALGLQELAQAYRLNPDASEVQALIERYSYDYADYIHQNADGSVQFTLPEQASPLPPGSDELLLTVVPTYTLEAPPPQDTPTKESGGSRTGFPLCSGAALLVLPLGLVAWRKRKP